LDLRSYCEKYCQGREEEVLKYLQEEASRIYKNLAKTYSFIAKR
jgi:hypothetical protein